MTNAPVHFMKWWISKKQQYYQNQQVIQTYLLYLLQNTNNQRVIQHGFNIFASFLKNNIEGFNKTNQIIINLPQEHAYNLIINNIFTLNQRYNMQNKQNYYNFIQYFAPNQNSVKQSLIYIMNNNILLNYTQKGNFYSLFQAQIELLGSFQQKEEMIQFSQKMLKQINFKSDFIMKLSIKLYQLTNDIRFAICAYKYASNKQKGLIYIILCQQIKNKLLVSKLVKLNRFEGNELNYELQKIKNEFYQENKSCISIKFQHYKYQLQTNIRSPNSYIDFAYWFLNPLVSYFNPFLALQCLHNAISLSNCNIQIYKCYIRLQLLYVLKENQILNYSQLIKIFRYQMNNLNKTDRLYDKELNILNNIIGNQLMPGSSFISDSYISYILMEEYEKIIQLQKLYQKAIEWQQLTNNNEQKLSNFINNTTEEQVEENQQAYMMWMSVSKRFIDSSYTLFQ